MVCSQTTHITTSTSLIIFTAAAQGIVSQARVLGGSIGLAVATIVFNRKLAHSLGGSLSSTALHNLQQSLSTIANLPPEEQAAVVKVYAQSFNDQLRICTYVSAFGVVAALCTYQRNPVDIAAVKQKQEMIQEEKESNGEVNSV
jgi:hypothetical protein